MLTFPSHTSHALQPLDITCFKPFKLSFRAYRDKWTVGHKGQTPIKEDLAEWVSYGLRRALTSQNIMKGFATIGIYPFDPTAMNNKMGPSEGYQRNHKSCETDAVDIESRAQLEEWELKGIFDEVQKNIPNCTQYYVHLDGDDEDCVHTGMHCNSTGHANSGTELAWTAGVASTQGLEKAGTAEGTSGQCINEEGTVEAGTREGI